MPEILFDEEKVDLIQTVERLSLQHSLSVSDLLATLHYVAELSDRGVRLHHIKRAVDAFERLRPEKT